jgi:hypothetical protein
VRALAQADHLHFVELTGELKEPPVKEAEYWVVFVYRLRCDKKPHMHSQYTDEPFWCERERRGIKSDV